MKDQGAASFKRCEEAGVGMYQREAPEVEGTHDRWMQRDGVGEGRTPEARIELAGNGGTPDDGTALEHERLQPRQGQVESRTSPL